MFGAATKEQMTGLPITRIIPPDSLDAHLCGSGGWRWGEKDLYPVEDVYLRVDGTLCPVR